jgi:hypothetical protein
MVFDNRRRQRSIIILIEVDADIGRSTGVSLAMSTTTLVVRDGRHNGSLGA